MIVNIIGASRIRLKKTFPEWSRSVNRDCNGLLEQRLRQLALLRLLQEMRRSSNILKKSEMLRIRTL